MGSFIFFVCLLFFLVYIFAKRSSQHTPAQLAAEKTTYTYQRKQFVMTNAEKEFFDRLVSFTQDDYYVFPQIHLSAILNHKVKGQNWKGAFSSINGKSVDYVICDKLHCKTLLAIELDDSTHDSAPRVERDANVERMLSEAGVPLIRFKNLASMQPGDIQQQVLSALMASH